MNSKFIAINERIGRTIKAPADQSRIVAIAAAFAAAAHGALPSSPLDNLPAYYTLQVLPVASIKLSELNENVIFGAKSALDYTSMFWKMRYYAAFPTKFGEAFGHRQAATLNGKAAGSLDAVSLLCGGHVFISEEMSEFMNKYKVEISTIAVDLLECLADPVPYNDGGLPPAVVV